MHVEVIRHTKRKKTISLEVTYPRTVIVRAPRYTSLTEINRIIQQNYAWIRQKISAFGPNTLLISRQDGQYQIPFQGKTYRLHIQHDPSRKRPLLEFHHHRLTFISNQTTPSLQLIKTTLLKWYRDELGRFLAERTAYYHKKLGTSHRQIRIKKARTIWGSCSTNKNLNFNLCLIILPEEVADYVIAHEVCHLVHPHHKASFWRCVEQVNPSFSEHRQWLRKNTHLISSFYQTLL